MKKVSIYWNNDSNDLVNLLNYLRDNGISAEPVAAEDYTGDGEEVYTDDVSALKEIASQFDCSVSA